MTEENDNRDQIEGESLPKRDIELEDSIRLGHLLSFLVRAGMHNYPVYDANDETYILGALRDVERILKETEFDPGVQTDVSDMKNRLEKNYDSPELAKEDEDIDIDDLDITIDSPHDRKLIERAETWIRLCRERIQSEERITVSSQGLIEIQRAIESPSALFYDENVWKNLSSQTKNDLQEAVQSLAFDCPTSSVFMSLRAVEERLQVWYKNETGREINDRTFGQVLSELDDYYESQNEESSGDEDDSEDERPAILSHLDYLNERRNQVAHPTRSPGMQEAESTIVMVRETITDIHKQLSEE